jgi:hypothetical protein
MAGDTDLLNARLPFHPSAITTFYIAAFDQPAGVSEE